MTEFLEVPLLLSDALTNEASEKDCSEYQDLATLEAPACRASMSGIL